jgi:hypothetical protein
VYDARTPDDNLVSRLRVVRLEKPEEQLPCLILVISDGKETSVALAHVPRDVGKRTAVHSESFQKSDKHDPKLASKTHVQWPDCKT